VATATSTTASPLTTPATDSDVVDADVFEERSGLAGSTPDHEVAPQTAFVLALLSVTTIECEPVFATPSGTTRYHSSTRGALKNVAFDTAIGVAVNEMPLKVTEFTVRAPILKLLEARVDTLTTMTRFVPAPIV
jgi:hypothetical protein